MTKIIYVDGSDGVGKGTIIDILKNKLQENGYSVLSLSAIGTDILGSGIRSKLKSESTIIDTDFQSLAMATANVDLTTTLKTLVRNSSFDYVLIDRWWASYWAYQIHHNRYIMSETIFRQLMAQSKILIPHKYLYIQVPIEENIKRINLREDNNQFDNTNVDYRQSINKGFTEFNNEVFPLISSDGIVVYNNILPIKDLDSDLNNLIDLIL